MRNKRFTSKTYLKVLIAVGVLAVIGGGAGTFASFTAQTTNAGNTFATGSLQLSDSANSGTACLSYNGSNNAVSSGCGAVLTASGAGAEPGGAIVSGIVKVSNTGTLDASKFRLLAPSATDCSDTQVTPLGSLNPATGNPLCGAVVMYVQETAQGGTSHIEPNDGTYTYCWYGDGAGSATCDTTLSDLDSANTTLTSFDTSEHTSGIELKPLTASGTLASSPPVELPAGDYRTFTVGLYLPSGAPNSLQALESTFGLTWHIDQ